VEGTVFCEGFLRGESRKTGDPSKWIEGEFDVGFFSSSWDRRSICITSAGDLSCETSILLLFDQRDDQGLRDSHDSMLGDYLRRHSAALIEITGKSVDTGSIWARIQGEVVRLAGGHRRPLRLYLDLSTLPRFFALGIIALCIKSGLVARLTVGYAEGLYPARAANSSVIESYPFTVGRWTTVAVPFLEGMLEPRYPKYYLISVGFEGAKTMRVVTREDPDRISILFPKPGFLPGYDDLTQEANKELIEKRLVPPEQIVNAPAADAIAAWKALEEASVERFNKENTYYLCCGTKPHSLALGIRSLVHESPAVLYNVPERYNPAVDVHPAGVYWRFDIEDVTAV
jgi:hypothetical protein